MFAFLRQPFLLLLPLCSPVAHHTQGETMKIQLEINGHHLQASLDDTPSGRDFYALLPLTLNVEEYAATETIGYLPRQLMTQGAPAGVDPQVGDISYYAPWGNLALFHHDFGYSKGLIRLGHIKGAPEVISRALRIESPTTLTLIPLTADSGSGAGQGLKPLSKEKN